MHIKYNNNPALGAVFMAAGIVLLAYVALYFAPWVIVIVAGWKLFSAGLRMRGYPPLAFFISRWF
jgi:hypothetical protein